MLILRMEKKHKRYFIKNPSDFNVLTSYIMF